MDLTESRVFVLWEEGTIVRSYGRKCDFMKNNFSHGKKYEIAAKIMHIDRLQLYCMKRVPNGGRRAVTEHFFMQIGGNMVSEHEMRQSGACWYLLLQSPADRYLPVRIVAGRHLSEAWKPGRGSADRMETGALKTAGLCEGLTAVSKGEKKRGKKEKEEKGKKLKKVIDRGGRIC